MNTMGMSGVEWAIWLASNLVTGAALLFIAVKLAWDRHRHAIPPDRVLFEVTAGITALQYLIRPWMMHASLFWLLIWLSGITAGVCLAVAIFVARGWRWRV